MLLKIEDLVVSFKSSGVNFRAVNEISLQVDEGKCLGIVGESGCGKSVSALSILRLVPQPAGKIEKGRILFQGEDLLKASERRIREIRGREIAMIFQEPMTSLNPVFTVGDQIEEAISLHQNLSKNKIRARCLEVMDLVGIPEPQKRVEFYPHQLSGGLRQRVMIAMALSCEPKLLIADEPTTALDVTIQAQILDLMKDLQKKLNMAMIMITHDFGVIAESADDVAVMYAGKIVEQGEVRQIFDQASHPYTRALQKSLPDFSKKQSKLYSIPFMVPTPKELAQGQDLESRWESLELDMKKESEALPPAKKFGPENEKILEVKDLKVHFVTKRNVFGKPLDVVKAVDGVSFDVKKGEVVGLVGESGCGKSTLGKTLLRLIKPLSGEIDFMGRNITNLQGASLRGIRKDIQMIFQDPGSSLNPRMKIGEILEEPLLVHKLAPKKDRKEKVLQLLNKVGLREGAYDKYPHEFSGGQRQRVGIARALAVEPDFIVADEPVSALDVSIQAQILNLLHDLKDEFDLTYLFVSHDLNVVQYLCDRIIVMHQGKIVEELHPDQLFDPEYELQDYTRNLLGAIPKRHPDEKRSLESLRKAGRS